MLFKYDIFKQTFLLNAQMKKFSLLTLLLALILACSKAPEIKKTQIEKENDSYGWLDDDTFQLRANGNPPEKPTDLTTAKLLACENARNFGLKLFNYRFLRNRPAESDSQLYPEQKFVKQFHDYKIEVHTVYKENDPGGNCYLQLQFKGKDLKKRLIPYEDKSVAPITPGWE